MVGGFDLEYLDHENFFIKRELKKLFDFFFFKPLNPFNPLDPLIIFSYS